MAGKKFMYAATSAGAAATRPEQPPAQLPAPAALPALQPPEAAVPALRDRHDSEHEDGSEGREV